MDSPRISFLTAYPSRLPFRSAAGAWFDGDLKVETVDPRKEGVAWELIQECASAVMLVVKRPPTKL
jgi:hypothetical protein